MFAYKHREVEVKVHDNRVGPWPQLFGLLVVLSTASKCQLSRGVCFSYNNKYWFHGDRVERWYRVSATPGFVVVVLVVVVCCIIACLLGPFDPGLSHSKVTP